MATYSVRSQNLMPSIIKINGKENYCFDSIGIRKIAVELNNSMYCDSIVDTQGATIKDQDSLITIKDAEIKNLNEQIKILGQEKKDESVIVKDLGGNKTKVGIFLQKAYKRIEGGLAVVGAVTIIILAVHYF
jgi:hypothetical protein